MRKIALLALLLVACVSISASSGPERFVRGKVYRIAPNGQVYAAQGIALSLNHVTYGRSTFSYSNSQGMYTFDVTRVPPGQYSLEIWPTQNERDRMLFAVQLLNQQYTDIAPIRVP